MKGLDQYLKQNSPLSRPRSRPAPELERQEKVKYTSLMRRDLYQRMKEQHLKEQKKDPARRIHHVIEDALTEYLNRHES